jgi:hypothetical protein
MAALDEVVARQLSALSAHASESNERGGELSTIAERSETRKQAIHAVKSASSDEGRKGCANDRSAQLSSEPRGGHGVFFGTHAVLTTTHAPGEDSTGLLEWSKGPGGRRRPHQGAERRAYACP